MSVSAVQHWNLEHALRTVYANGKVRQDVQALGVITVQDFSSTLPRQLIVSLQDMSDFYFFFFLILIRMERFQIREEK